MIELADDPIPLRRMRAAQRPMTASIAVRRMDRAEAKASNPQKQIEYRLRRCGPQVFNSAHIHHGVIGLLKRLQAAIIRDLDLDRVCRAKLPQPACSRKASSTAGPPQMAWRFFASPLRRRDQRWALALGRPMGSSGIADPHSPHNLLADHHQSHKGQRPLSSATLPSREEDAASRGRRAIVATGRQIDCALFLSSLCLFSQLIAAYAVMGIPFRTTIQPRPINFQLVQISLCASSRKAMGPGDSLALPPARQKKGAACSHGAASVSREDRPPLARTAVSAPLLKGSSTPSAGGERETLVLQAWTSSATPRCGECPHPTARRGRRATKWSPSIGPVAPLCVQLSRGGGDHRLNASERGAAAPRGLASRGW